MSDAPDRKQLLHQILKTEGKLFLVGGSFLATKHFFSEIALIDIDTDFYLGCGLIILGFTNIFIANKFFGYKKTT